MKAASLTVGLTPNVFGDSRMGDERKAVGSVLLTALLFEGADPLTANESPAMSAFGTKRTSQPR